MRSPFRTAERFGVEEIIDPRDTRPLLCDWAERAHELVALRAARRSQAPRPAAVSGAEQRQDALERRLGEHRYG